MYMGACTCVCVCVYINLYMLTERKWDMVCYVVLCDICTYGYLYIYIYTYMCTYLYLCT